MSWEQEEGRGKWEEEERRGRKIWELGAGKWEEEEERQGKSRGERIGSRTRGQNSFRFGSEQIV